MRKRSVILCEQGESIDRFAEQMWMFAQLGERDAFDKWATDLAAGAFGRGFEFCETHHLLRNGKTDEELVCKACGDLESSLSTNHRIAAILVKKSEFETEKISGAKNES